MICGGPIKDTGSLRLNKPEQGFSQENDPEPVSVTKYLKNTTNTPPISSIRQSGTARTHFSRKRQMMVHKSSRRPSETYICGVMKTIITCSIPSQWNITLWGCLWADGSQLLILCSKLKAQRQHLSLRTSRVLHRQHGSTPDLTSPTFRFIAPSRWVTTIGVGTRLWSLRSPVDT